MMMMMWSCWLHRAVASSLQGAGIRISASKFEAAVLSQRATCPLWPAAHRQFRCVGALFMSGGRGEWEADRLGAATAGMWMLHRCVVVKKS